MSARFAVLGTKPNDSGIVQVYELGASGDRAAARVSEAVPHRRVVPAA